MSVKVTNAVWDHSKATGNDLIVLLKIADEADDSGDNAFPGFDYITKKSKLPKRTVMRCVDRLEAMGELIVTRPQQPGRGRFNSYRVVLPGLGDKVSPFPAQEKGAERRAKARIGDTTSALTSTDAEYPEPLTQNPEDSFARFWSIYPRKTAKGAAKSKWPKALKAVDGDVERIIAGAERYRDDPNREDWLTAHASTWLNGERWDDPPLPPRPSTNGHKLDQPKVVSFAERKAADERERRERSEALRRLGVDA